MFEMRFPEWAFLHTVPAKCPTQAKRGLEWATLGGSRLSANSNMRPLPWAKTGGQKQPHSRHAPRQKSENLSKDQFGVLAKGTLRKLYSRIEAPWPELIEGVCPLVHQMLNERRELHKIAQQATHLLSIHCLYQTSAGSARGL